MSGFNSIIQDGKAIISLNNASTKYISRNQFELTNSEESGEIIAVGSNYLYVDNNAENLYTNPTHKYICQNTHIAISTTDENHDNTYAICVL